ncbi:nitrite reductase [Nocardioides sp. CFH 31398]|uniref:nitrite reductase n=1 Tax=Nocardioides sp. CFH 31398 TaxID=2919579 RepID=UPI001F065E0B|nr:nitrite reductase [Nocardioides sp. CFH 31398]MCH1865532.1 nitrite reductase [Nocardioides sp. CFH 31398]
MSPPTPTGARTRADRCPGLARPWIADDGALVRLRLLGGAVGADQLAALLDVAEAHGDGAVHLTRRANLQLRALPHDGEGRLRPDVADAVLATGLVPSASHELVRNYLLSPGLGATRADLRPLLSALDAAVCGSRSLARLSARFLVVLDDGGGEVLDRPCDLGLVALSGTRAQLRVGDGLGPVIDLTDAVPALVALAETFAEARGTGPDAPWHVTELPAPLDHPLAVPTPPDPALPAPTGAPPYDAAHVAVPDGRLTRGLPLPAGDLVVTPWRSVVPDPRRAA